MLEDHNDANILCDDCLNNPRPWTSGRAVFAYNAKARSMILALKGKDRHDLIAPFAHWMLRRGAEIFHLLPCSFQFHCIGNGNGTDGLINPRLLRRRWRMWRGLTAVWMG